ncbi:MAG: hypothetical protein HYY00_04685 [Chloroflexi bacterium]|nr:hypothetical protein [Chloroflexota bacterium]
MSKLGERLERIGRGSSAPLGFGAAVKRERLPGILFIGTVSSDHSDGARALAEGKADAALLRASGEKGDEVQSARQALGDTPWGLWVASPTEERMASLKEEGCDFVVFESDQVTASALADDAMARVMAISPGLDDRTLRALEGLPVDALLVRLPEKASPMNLRHLLDIGVVRSMTSKYLLLEHPCLPNSKEVELLRDAGVDGVVVDVSSATAEELDQFRRRLMDLPQKKQKAERSVATLPATYSRMGTPRREDEEEEEEEDV